MGEDAPRTIGGRLAQSFELVNYIVEDRISRPKQIAELCAKLPEDKRKGIEARNAKPKVV